MKFAFEFTACFACRDKKYVNVTLFGKYSCSALPREGDYICFPIPDDAASTEICNEFCRVERVAYVPMVTDKVNVLTPLVFVTSVIRVDAWEAEAVSRFWCEEFESGERYANGDLNPFMVYTEHHIEVGDMASVDLS